MTLHFSPDETDIVSRPTSITSNTSADTSSAFAFSVPNRIYRTWIKRAVDIFLILIAAPLIVPIVAVMAFLIMLGGHTPFYTQMRVGRGNKTFRIWKLRTMVRNADAMLESHLIANPEARREWNSTQKLKNDPRITLVGRVLRKTSLDELPQLWNVLNGTMSLVGPRPMMLSQRDAYPGRAYYRLSPGITGLWQISERNEGAFTGRVKFDEVYDKTLSLKTDLWVLVRTVGVVLRGTGY